MSDAVAHIKDQLSIIDVVSPYVELHKAGKSFKGKSPFTSEKTPSFYVSPERGMYYCFSTSQGGDMFTFIQAMEGVDFKEALKILAQKAGVELIPEKPEQKTARERSLAALSEAARWYQGWLNKNPVATTYVADRGLHATTLAKWQIGYAPGPPTYGWREGKQYLAAQGYTTEELLKVGLIKPVENGKESFDVFRDRIMFPLFDGSGRVVGFSGRILTAGTEAPKYVNSPETDYYKKSDLLYGLDKAKEGIRKLDFALIVEGQFDVVLCHQAGYVNTVAVSGTALTVSHVQQLERFSRRVVLALDADRAGIAAMKKAAEVMLARGIDIKIAELPEGKDPADVIRQNPADFKQVIGHAVPVIEFLLHVLRRQYADARTYKLKARDEVLPFVLLLPNRIDQEHFVSVIADALTTPADAIRYELDRLRTKMATSPEVAPSSQSDINTESTLSRVSEEQIVELASTVVGTIPVVAVAYRQILEAVYAEVIAYQTQPCAIRPEIAARAAFQLEERSQKLRPLEVFEVVVSTINRLRQLIVQAELARLRASLAAAEAVADIGQQGQLMATIQQLSQVRALPPYVAANLVTTKD